MATARTKPSSDQPTFGGPGSDRLEVLPGEFFVRVHPGAIRPHVPTRTRAAFGTSRMAFTATTAAAIRRRSPSRSSTCSKHRADERPAAVPGPRARRGSRAKVDERRARTPRGGRVRGLPGGRRHGRPVHREVDPGRHASSRARGRCQGDRLHRAGAGPLARGGRSDGERAMGAARDPLVRRRASRRARAERGHPRHRHRRRSSRARGRRNHLRAPGHSGRGPRRSRHARRRDRRGQDEQRGRDRGVANCAIHLWKVFPDEPVNSGFFVDPDPFADALRAAPKAGIAR